MRLRRGHGQAGKVQPVRELGSFLVQDGVKLSTCRSRHRGYLVEADELRAKHALRRVKPAGVIIVGSRRHGETRHDTDRNNREPVLHLSPSIFLLSAVLLYVRALWTRP